MIAQFHKDEQGLPHIDLNKPGCKAAVMLLKTAMEIDGNEAENKHGFVNRQIVYKNYKGYTKCEVLKTKETRQAQGLIGSLNKSDYKGMVRGNMIQNCPLTSKDITNRCAIFGPDLASIRGKTVQRTPALVMVDYVNVPRSVVETNRIVTMVADVFFGDGMAFLIMVFWCIQFIMAEHLQIRMATSLCKHLEQVGQVYARAGFVVRTILMDGEFEKVETCTPNVK
jgi:hypothetical protein